MNRYDLVLALLQKGKELAEHPSQQRRAESLDILSQIAGIEQANEAILSPIGSKAALRGGKPQAMRVGKQPVSFTLDDTQGSHVALILEAAPTSEGVRLSGEFFAEETSNWERFTVVVSQKSKIQDYSEIEGTREFSLLLAQPGHVTLKLISSLGEAILLENVEVVSE
jgi:hypothetical protein